MIGLVYLVVFVVYFAISEEVVRGAIRYARNNGKSAKRWGWGAAFVMYSIVFWDWIPTVAVHQFYCAKDSGFWIYKTLDQWKRENPGEAYRINKEYEEWAEKYYDQYIIGHPFGEIYTKEQLKNHQVSRGNTSEVLIDGERSTYIENVRFNLIVAKQDVFSLLPVIRTEWQVKDSVKNEVLASYVDFGTGNSVQHFVSMPLKFWLHSGNCHGDTVNRGNFDNFLNSVRNIN